MVDEIKQIDPKYLPTGGVGHTTESTEDITLFFDGLIGDKENFYFGDNISAIKISNITPTIEELIDGVVTVNILNQGDVTVKLTADNVVDGTKEMGIPAILIPAIGNIFAIIALEDFSAEGYSLTKGLWCMAVDGATAPEESITWKFEYKGKVETVNKIDSKFLYQPDWN